VSDIVPPPFRLHIFPDSAELADKVAALILHHAEEAITERGRFSIVLAGGNTPRAVYQRLRSAGGRWSRWDIYFGDERCVPRNNPARNDRMARAAWLDHVPIPHGRIHKIPAELGAELGARTYASTLEVIGDFDLVLLGLGEDGHTASLFPGHPLGASLNEPVALAVHDAPKPLSDRVSLSAARLSAARRVYFLVTGDGKRDALAQLTHGDDIPAAHIRPPSGVDFFITADVLPVASSQE
jgi:6-phosphogluconolactonase